jgi:hypothetical protein
MANGILFDKLIFIDRLKRAGISDDHARAHAEAMDEALRESVATKIDLQMAVRDLTIRVGGMIILLAGFLTSIRFFGH